MPLTSPSSAADAPRPAIEAVSYGLMGLGLLLVLHWGLLPSLVAGMLVYSLVQTLAPKLEKHLPGARSRVVVVAVLGACVIGLLLGVILGGITFYRHEIGNPEAWLQNQLMPLIDHARQQLPIGLVEHLPGSVEDLRSTAAELSRRYAATLQLAGKQAVRTSAYVLIGLLLGAVVALSQTSRREAEEGRGGPLARALAQRCAQLAASFRDIVFAQIKISLLNTFLTAIFLLIALPLCGITLPLTKTLVALTFVFGLLPVIGNLLSNVAIVLAGLSVSLWIGLIALIYLVVVHKLEYFLNARIVGGQIRARAWELLAAMLLMEAACGLAGVVAAPIYYAYLKRELERKGLI